jgi:hypothetical protein
MACEFMALRNDLSHHLWMAFRNPAKGEEGRFHVMLIEQGEYLVDVALDPTMVLTPRASINILFERRDLEIVLNIDRHDIAQLLHGNQ